MDDPAFVRRFERVTDLPCDGERLLERNRTFFYPLGKGRPFHQFHHQVVGTHVMERADVGMIQCRHRARFATESFVEFWRSRTGF